MAYLPETCEIYSTNTKYFARHILFIQNTFGTVYYNKGQWDKAEKLFVQVIETRKTKLGVDHPDTLTSIANLASTLWN